MKKTILKYSSLLALLGSFFFSTYIFAAECETGTSPTAGCSIGVSDITYTLTGDIEPGSGVDGIQFNSENSALNLTGNITTTGINGRGIYLSNSNNNITTLIGDISSDGTQGHGIYSLDSNSNTYSLIGDISTSANSALGIYLKRSDSNIMNMTGDIATAGDWAYGILVYDTSESNSITMTGNITTTGVGAVGIYSLESNSNTFSLIGDISTSGSEAYGIYSLDSNSNTYSLIGDISSDGTRGYGIYLLRSDSNNTTMTGAITTTGSSAHGLHLVNSDSNTVNITGGISATGSNAYAIYADSSADNNIINLTLNRGVRLVGDIYNDGSGNTLNITLNSGRTASYIYTSSGSTDLTWNVTDSSKPVINGSAKSRGIADIDDAGNKLYQRFNPISRATSSQHKRIAMGDVRHDFWIDGYYSDSDRTTSYKELNHKTRGLTVGFNVSGDRQLPLDLIVNIENSNTGYGQSDQSIDTNSVMAGLFYPKLIQAFNGSLALKFLTGVADNESDIKVLNNTVTSGQETVTEDYTSYYVMVGGEWLQPLYQGENIHHDIYLGLDVMHEKIYSHSSSSYFYMSDRDITQLNSSVHYGFSFNSSDKKLLISAKAGIEQTDMLEGEYQYYKVDGTATRFKGDERNTYMTASLGADYKFTDNARAYFNVHKLNSSDDIDGTSGNVGFIYSF